MQRSGTVNGAHVAGAEADRGLLERIESPADLRELPVRALPQLADELREELVGLGAEIGGHFAGSLGTVELTVALHYVFNTPEDRVIFDVGHQAYGHKVLTGRRREMKRIKKADGPSGFLRRSESEHDVFGAGHAGTSISAGLGIAEAFARDDEKRRSVVVIGDGAATAGMAFEALNHAGELGRPLVVIFNDNGMSIAPNVGGLSKTGNAKAYFESLGLEYRGPVDGHALYPLIDELRKLDDVTGPVVLHVKTRKGRGYAPAEADPFRWHATGGFDVASGERKPAPKAPASWTTLFADILAKLADADPRLVAITAAMPDGTGLDRFAKTHPDRMYDVGIAEQHAVTFAAGMATQGMKPVCAIYSTFLQRGFDQIVHDVALQNLPVVFAMDRAGLVGADGPTHHGVLDLAYLRIIPNLVIAAPRDPNELQRLLVTALDADQPFAVRFPRGTAPAIELDEHPEPLEIGRAEQLRRGDDVAIVALGKTVDSALAAAELLVSAGISATVVDARFVKPLDEELLCEVARNCDRIVTVEDHGVHGGLGSALLEMLAVNNLRPAVRCLGIGDRFVDHGDTDEQWCEVGIDPRSVAMAARELVESDSRAGVPKWPSNGRSAAKSAPVLARRNSA